MSADPIGGRDVTMTLAAFARALDAAGVPVTPDRTQGFLLACTAVGAASRSGVYWAGRATLCSEPDQLDAYDRVFEAWFSGVLPRRTTSQRPAPPLRSVLADDDAAPPLGTGSDEGPEPDVVRALASAQEVLRHRDVATMTPSEKAMLAQMFTAIRPRSPRRRTTRRRPANRGEVDARRTLREELRRAGEPGPVRWRRRSTRPRRVILLVDVSGSMSPYADTLLRLAHVWVRSAPRSTEVFSVGTRLTRLTRALRLRDPEAALRAAGGQVPDWSGGTRLGDVLRAFLDRWGQRGMARGAVVVVASDGWERGDVALLGEQMRRLSRLAHRVVWVNPHRGKAGYLPVQLGIAAALPHCDDLLAGHSLATFANLVEVVARA